jgi:hypothetical protein
MTQKSRQIWLSIIVMMILSLVFLPLMAQAHQSSTAYLTLAPQHSKASANPTINNVQADYRLAVRDLALLLPIDANQDQAVTWQELLDQSTAIHDLLREQMVFAQATGQSLTPCQIDEFQPLRLDQVAGLVYVDQRFSLNCRDTPPAQLRYQILDQMDAGHRLIITHTPTGSTVSDAIPRTWMAANGTIILADAPSHSQMIKNYLIEGTHHLLIGADHLLFLLCLLLPAVYYWHQGKQQPVERAGPAIRQTLWIATAFTVAHSITLSLAALQIVHIPARWIEAAIAASIALAALNNLYPVFKQRQAWIAFGFGLIHGFGFANVLSDLPLATTERVMALLSFNLGIELGQVLCILIFLPIALALRQTTFYRRVMLIGGSSLAVVIALLWMMQRLLGQQWIYG